DAGGMVVQIENLAIKRHLGRTGRSDVGQRRRLELRTGYVHFLARRKHNPQSFGVDEKECLVLFYRATQRRTPLIGIVERPRRCRMVVEPIVGIHDTAVPEIFEIAVKVVGSGLGDVIYGRAAELSVLTRVAVVDNRGFLYVVLSQQQVGSAGIVQVQEWIIFILAVDGEQIGSSWKTVRGSVAISGLRIHDSARRSLHDVTQIIARVGKQCDLLGSKGSRDVAVLRLYHATFGGNFYGGASATHCQLEIHHTGLSD